MQVKQNPSVFAHYCIFQWTRRMWLHSWILCFCFKCCFKDLVVSLQLQWWVPFTVPRFCLTICFGGWEWVYRCSVISGRQFTRHRWGRWPLTARRRCWQRAVLTRRSKCGTSFVSTAPTTCVSTAASSGRHFRYRLKRGRPN